MQIDPSRVTRRLAGLLASTVLVVGLTGHVPTSQADSPVAGPVDATFTGYEVFQVTLCSQACHSRTDTGARAAQTSWQWIAQGEGVPVPPGTYRLSVYVGDWTYGYLRRDDDGRYDIVPTFDEATEFTIAGATDLGEIHIREPNYPEGTLETDLDGMFFGSTIYPKLLASNFEPGATVTVRQYSCPGGKPRTLVSFDPAVRTKVKVGINLNNVGPDYYIRVDITAPGRTPRLQKVPTTSARGACDAHRLVSGDGVTWSAIQGRRQPVVGRYAKVTPTLGEDAHVTYRWQIGNKIVRQGSLASDRRLKIKRAWLGKHVRVLTDVRFPAGTELDGEVYFGPVVRKARKR